MVRMNFISHKNKTHLWALMGLMLLALAGCGNKGDLYLPEDDKQEQTKNVDDQNP